MFARTLVALFLGVAAVQVSAAPMHSRQLGNLDCNINRLAIVAGLAKTQSQLKDLATVVGSDATASAAVKNVTDSVSAAQKAIGNIGKALITFQKAAPEDRVIVQSSLFAANGTLASVAANDANTQSLLAQTQASLVESIGAGDGVVSNCK